MSGQPIYQRIINIYILYFAKHIVSIKKAEMSNFITIMKLILKYTMKIKSVNDEEKDDNDHIEGTDTEYFEGNEE